MKSILFFKRSISILFVALIIFANTTTVFAIDETSVTKIHSKESLDENTSDEANVGINGTAYLYPQLGWHISSQKELIVSATTVPNNSGALFLYLYNPKGELVSFDWIMGVNETVTWTVESPPSGKWTLKVVAQGNTATVYVFANWK